jgi:hypothetical protein
MKSILYAPEAFWILTPEQRQRYCNGCGPGKVGSRFIPNRIWGLDVSECCNIHDFMYWWGSTIEDKREADRTFLNNMLRVIDTNSSGWLLNTLRRRMALKYYTAVATFGGPAFWKNVNPAANMREEGSCSRN